MNYELALVVALAAGAAFFAVTRVAPRLFRTGEDVNRALLYLLVVAAIAAAILID